MQEIEFVCDGPRNSKFYWNGAVFIRDRQTRKGNAREIMTVDQIKNLKEDADNCVGILQNKVKELFPENNT